MDGNAAPHVVIGVASLGLADPHGGMAVLYSLRTNTVTATAACGNIEWYTCDSCGVAAAEAALWSAIDACLAVAGAAYADVSAVCVCPNVRDAPSDLAALRAALAARLPPHAVVLAHSAGAAALASCMQGVLHGACIVADDAAEAAAFNTVGDRQHRTSGWGPAFVDGGSAHDLGVRALLAMLKAHDGRGARTCVTGAVTQELGLSRPEELVKWAYDPPGGEAGRAASIAGTVIECAAAGDAVADTILRHGVGELFKACKTSISKVGLGSAPFKVMLAGRLLWKGGLYSQYLAEAIQEQLPNADVRHLKSEPAEAAALLALRELALRQHAQQAQQAQEAQPQR
ncbi:MAG: hypothetical protein J3K34DRAFT_165995 [Monoraphidium minutum]|nr:MAG: hypothetical protein J3K34DRAFT_165995 [Monoraphidium minutum]